MKKELSNLPLRKYVILFGTQTLSLIGSKLVDFSLIWWLTSVSRSATVLAIASIMAVLPQVLIGPFTGAYIDRWNRRIVMIVADSIIALITFVLVLLYFVNTINVWYIYFGIFFRSLLGTFQWTAMQAATSLMVPDRNLSRVAGLNQSLNALANIIAPPLGALLLSLMPIQNVLLIDIGTAPFAIIPLFLISIPKLIHSKRELKQSVLLRIREGMRFLWEWKGIRWIIIIAMLVNFLTIPAISLLPIHVKEFFNKGIIELAYLETAYGIGIILGGFALGVRGGFKRRVLTALVALASTGIGLIIFGFTPTNLFIIAIVSLFFSVFMYTIANGIIFAILQSIVPPEIQGRVFSLLLSLSTGVAPLGLAISGPIADTFGVSFWYILGGVLILLSSAVSFFIPTIRYIEKTTF